MATFDSSSGYGSAFCAFPYDDILSASGFETARGRIIAHFVARTGPVVLDLRGASAIDRQQLRVLGAVAKWATSRRRAFAVVNVSGELARLCFALGLDPEYSGLEARAA